MSGPASTPGWEELDWYETPRYYDAVFDVDSAREADFLEAAHALHAGPSPTRRRARRVLEPACGSGRLMLELARRGWQVTGFDLEPAMVDHTRRRLARARRRGTVAPGDMAGFRVRGRFDLAHCLVSTFKYLLTEADARSHLECVAGALRPGGIYCLGLHLTDYARTRPDRERWTVERGAVRIDCTITSGPADRRARLEPVEARMKVVDGGTRRRAVTRWSFRTYDAAQLRRLLRSVPALEHVGTYDFHHAIDEPQRLCDDLGDAVLVLRRR